MTKQLSWRKTSAPPSSVFHFFGISSTHFAVTASEYVLY